MHGDVTLGGMSGERDQEQDGSTVDTLINIKGPFISIMRWYTKQQATWMSAESLE